VIHAAGLEASQRSRLEEPPAHRADDALPERASAPLDLLGSHLAGHY